MGVPWPPIATPNCFIINLLKSALPPLVAAVLISAIAAVVTRCLTAADAYRAIHWQSLVLLAGMLPLADALQRTGGTDIIVDQLVSISSGASPQVLLVWLFFIT